MRLGLIAAKIIAASTRFENRVGGTVELDLAITSTLQKDMAFVVPLGETASPNENDTIINQLVTERFAVVVALASDTSQRDKSGITAYDTVDDARADIFHAILGWTMPDTDYFISYAGGSILDFSRAYLWYEFDFDCAVRIGQDDGVTEEGDIGLLNTIYAQLKTREY